MPKKRKGKSRFVTVTLGGTGDKFVHSDGLVPDGHYTNEGILLLIRLVQSRGWQLISATNILISGTQAHVLEIAFQKA